jgi:hypothetical protein
MTTVDHGRHSAAESDLAAGDTTLGAPAGPVPPPPAGPDGDEVRPGGPGDRRLLLIGAIIVACVVLLALTIAGLRALDRHVGRDHDGRDHDDRGSHRVTGAAHGRDTATLSLVSGVTSVTVRSGDLHGDMYRVSTPDDGSLLPAVTDHDDRIDVQLTDSGEHGASAVLIELSDDVAWHLRVGGGASQATLDLHAGGLASLDFVNGISSIEVNLPQPHGTVPVRLSGGASTWTVHLPTGVPARLAVTGGAGSVSMDGTRQGGTSQQTFTTGEYDTATDRYDLQALSGVSTVLVDHR